MPLIVSNSNTMRGNISTEIKDRPHSVYDVENQFHSGATTGEGDAITWQQCREFFHKYFNKVERSKGVYYGTEKIKQVARMFNWVEGVLNLSKRSIIYPCKPVVVSPNYCNSFSSCNKRCEVLYVELSPFWLSMKVRSYFITIMLRAAHYAASSKKPLEALMQSSYCQATRPATAAFLHGYTIVPAKRDDSNGYYEYNRGWTVQLIKPSVKLRKPSSWRERIWFEDHDANSRLNKTDMKKIEDWVNVTTKSKFSFARLK